VPEKLPKNVGVDVLGAVLCAMGLGGAVYGFIEQPRYGWSDPLVVAPIVIGVVALVVFLLYERRIKNPMLPMSLFRVRNFSVGNIATLAIYAGLSVATFIIVIFVQSVGGYSALQAGPTLLPVTLIMFVLSPRFGALAGKYGPRWFMAFGPILAAVGFLLMLRVDSSIVYWAQIFPGVLVFGLGLSMTVAPLTSAVLGHIDSRNAGMGSDINNAVARIAGLIAIAMIGLVVGRGAFIGTVAHGVDAFHKGAVAMAVLLLAGGIISAIGITNHKNPDSQSAGV
jgi:Na+/melibiose symporter-like transporter